MFRQSINPLHLVLECRICHLRKIFTFVYLELTSSSCTHRQSHYSIQADLFVQEASLQPPPPNSTLQKHAEILAKSC